MRGAVVGRESELAALAACLHLSQAERKPAAALVVGDPGSGKTTLLAELERRASLHVVRIVGFEPIRRVPLAAAAELLRTLASARAPAVRTTAAVPITDLEGILLGSRDRAGGDALQVFEAAHLALTATSPVLLLVDDLQWLDDLSLGLLHYLLRAAEPARQALAVVAAARPSPAAAAFAALIEAEAGSGRHQIVELGPLPFAAGRLLARSLDARLDDEAADDLWRRAAGSPFWIAALTRSGSRRHPNGLLDARLRSVTADAGQILAALAVAARPLGLDALGELLGWPESRAAAAASEAAARGLVIDGTVLTLAHDLVRAAVIEWLPRERARGLHGSLAGLLERVANGEVQLLCEALEHRRRAGLAADDLAAQIVAAPGRRLLRPDDLRAIGAIADGLAPGSDVRRKIDRGIAALAAEIGDQALALERWSTVAQEDASRDASAGGGTGAEDKDHRAADLEAARAAYWLRRPTVAHLHLDRAAGAVSSEVGAIDLDVLRAEVAMWLDHDTVGGRRFADAALAAARSGRVVGGPSPMIRRAELAALSVAIDAAMQEDRVGDMIALADESLAVARDLDALAQVEARVRVGFALQVTRRLRQSEACYREAWTLASRLILPPLIVEAGLGLVRALHELGRLDEARRIVIDIEALDGRLIGAPRRWGSPSAVRHVLELDGADRPTALRAVAGDAEGESDPHFRLAIQKGRAVHQAHFGGPEAARVVVADLAAAWRSAALAGCPRCSTELELVGAECLALVGRPEECRNHLKPWLDRPAHPEARRGIWTTRARAALAATEGRTRESSDLLSSLEPELGRDGLAIDLLWLRIELGRSLASIDRSAAIATFERAAGLAEEMGAMAQSRLVAQELRRLGVRAWRRSAAHASQRTPNDRLKGLSSRERDVARLIVSGHRNREIAEALIISPKTVERHVTNILAKSGARNRIELVRLAGAAEIGAIGYGVPPMNRTGAGP